MEKEIIEIVLLLRYGQFAIFPVLKEQLQKFVDQICACIDSTDEKKYLNILNHESLPMVVDMKECLGFYVRNPLTTHHSMEKMAESFKKIVDSETKGEGWKDGSSG